MNPNVATHQDERSGRSLSARSARIASIALVTLAAPLAGTTAATAAAKTYKNCAALQRVYPHGVGKSGARDKTSGVPVTNFRVSATLYNANTGLDRDRDKIACEKR